jgi:hypothetical protein
MWGLFLPSEKRAEDHELNDPTSTPRPLNWRTPLLMFSLWIPATLFFAGNLGWWNDDYFFNGRDPATGRVIFWIQTAPNPFEAPSGIQVWRPLNFLFTTSLITAFWNHDWVVHWIGALAHLFACFLLYRVLHALKLSKQACLLGTLILLCCPVGFEAILWASAIATGLATSMLFAVILLYIRHAQRTLSHRGHLALGLLASSIPLMNEQPAASLAALPILYLSLRPAGERLRTSLWRAISPLILPALSHALYLFGIAVGLPPSSYGSANSLVTLAILPHRLLSIAAQMAREFAGANLGLGALAQGWHSCVSSPALAVAAAALFAAACVLQCRQWSDTTLSPRVNTPTSSRAWLILFALALLALTLLPLAAVSWVHVRPRMAYATTAALAILVACVGNALRDLIVSRAPVASRIPRAYATITGIAIAPLALAGSIMLVGVQSGYRARSRADAHSIAQLVELLGPPAPDSFFLPLSVENRALNSGTPRFDWYFASAWYWSYAFPTFARQSLHRDDIESGFADVSRPLLHQIDDAGFHFAGPARFDPEELYRGQGRRTFWHDAITFQVSADGEASLLSPIRVERDGVLIEEHPVPQVETARARGASRIKAWTITLH